jgi:hypothetical protein
VMRLGDRGVGNGSAGWARGGLPVYVRANEARNVLQLEMRKPVIIHSHTSLCDGATD